MQEKLDNSSIPKAIFINGGAGRILSSIPALETHFKTNPNSIIICEGTDEFFKNHPLYKKVFNIGHKNLFEDYIKDRIVLTPEPYRRREYYNQECSISQGFDLEINDKMSIDISDYKPTIYLTSTEEVKGQLVINQLKEASGYDNFVVLQPFGSGIKIDGKLIMDESGRSIEYSDTIKLIEKISENCGVILMSDVDLELPEGMKVGRPKASLREWASIIKASDHFVGCDSVGQHIAFAVGTPTTVILGGTYPINVSYPNTTDVTIIDLGEKDREYSPIRLTPSESEDMHNSDIMRMNHHQLNNVVNSIKKPLTKPTLKESSSHKCDNNCKDKK